jgi:hypothetical protein
MHSLADCTSQWHTAKPFNLRLEVWLAASQYRFLNPVLSYDKGQDILMILYKIDFKVNLFLHIAQTYFYIHLSFPYPSNSSYIAVIVFLH